MTTHFIVHDKDDAVGVVVVEDVQPGSDVTGWIMETDETIQLKSLDAVPLGHKIALRYLKVGDVVECEIEGIGILRNRVVSWEEAYGRKPAALVPQETSLGVRPT